MEIYVVIEDIDDYPEAGGGSYPDAVFLSYVNAVRYANRKQQETDMDEFNTGNITWRVETWETADEKERRMQND